MDESTRAKFKNKALVERCRTRFFEQVRTISKAFVERFVYAADSMHSINNDFD
jgi:hypothetical protein